ncbi:MAG: hypothetical protein PVG27_08380 [Chloroflexota bacterium]
MPRSRNTRIRPKNTSRAEARRRYRDEQREVEAEAGSSEADAEAQAEDPQAQQRSSWLQMPDIADDVRHLPQVFRKPLVWLPFGLLLLAFTLELMRQGGAIPEGQVGDILVLYIQLTLPPTSLFVFFIGGFVAPRASYMVGGLLGAFDALLITILVMRDQNALAGSGVTEVSSEAVSLGSLAPLWGMALLIGTFAGGFAAWYRRFLRSSQERAAANRAAREREQAEKAKEQARADRATLRQQKYADREARRKRSS